MAKIQMSNTGRVGQQIGKQKIEGNSQIAGRDIHNYYSENKKDNLKLSPEGPDNVGLELSKQYWKFISKGKGHLVLGLVLPSLVSVFLVQDYWVTKLFENFYPMTAGLLILVLELTATVIKFTNSCPKCKKGFAVSEIDRELTNEKEYPNKIIRNIKVTNACRYCDHVSSRIVVDTEMKPEPVD